MDRGSDVKEKENTKTKNLVSKRTSKKRTRVPPSEISKDVGWARQVMSRSGYVKPELVHLTSNHHRPPGRRESSSMKQHSREKSVS